VRSRWCSSRAAGRRRAARRSRTASAGSRARRASSHRARSRPSRAPSSSESADAHPSGRRRTNSRIRSSPSAPHHVVDGRRRTCRLASKPLRLRGLEVSTTRGRRRAARGPSAFRIFSSSSRAGSSRGGAQAGAAPAAGGGSGVDADLGAGPGVLETAIVPPSPRRCSSRSAGRGRCRAPWS
jgi:hypothetical protein